MSHQKELGVWYIQAYWDLASNINEQVFFKADILTRHIRGSTGVTD